ncbi:LAME_0H03620g1_1 [Lachancea meyersii CBS 8951]|uniref:LAME_0H03620g1_1 n=1 Tax=Lachancea meyersii CBS 8951 TaxID=1266667 RepID=A0A1G4KDP7_9SACH|nr:LAME_0H03620g1_1 [Lachancea meyersii CBS 8951]
MPFNWNRKRVSSSVRGSKSNEDGLSSDASLKAAQAIFRKHEAPAAAENKYPALPTPQVHQRQNVTPGRLQQKLQGAQRSKIVASKPVSQTSAKSPSPSSTSSQNLRTAAEAAAATAQKSILTVQPRVKSKHAKFGQLWNTSGEKKHSVPAFPSLANEQASQESSNSKSAVKSAREDDLADILAKLQGTKETILPGRTGRAEKSGSSSPRNNVSTDSIISLNTSSEDVARLHPLANSNGPPLLSRQATRNGSGLSGFHSSECDNLSPGTQAEHPIFLSAKANSNRTITPRRSTSRNQTKEDISDSLSVSSAQSSAYSGLPAAGFDPSSDQNFSELSISPRAGPYRHELARSSIDQSSVNADLYSDRTSVDGGLGKGLQNIKYHGTLPDLIPNHTRDKKKGRLSSIFGRKRKSFDGFNAKNSSNNSNESGVSKVNQPTRLKTTMRTTSLDYEDSNSEESSDEYESKSENEDAMAASKKKKPKRRRVRIRKKIQKASGHNHSHKKSFNEDKPWKSHIDIGFVTQMERKRYEGIWLTNRNCYLELLPWWNEPEAQAAKRAMLDEGLMLNLVVMAIWSRSNLPQDKLAAIYDMVDTRNDWTLDRKSFIVGMWLVDQSLYGRKLPARILPRVWESVDRYVINVPKEAHLGLKHEDKQKQMKQELKQLKKDLKRAQI